jgi:hypothetical protein
MNTDTRPFPYRDIEHLGGASGFVDAVLEAINREVLFDEFYHYEIEELCQFMHCFSAPAGTVHSLAMVGPGSILVQAARLAV